jgi:hypothetical protein
MIDERADTIDTLHILHRLFDDGGEDARVQGLTLSRLHIDHLEQIRANEEKRHDEQALSRVLKAVKRMARVKVPPLEVPSQPFKLTLVPLAPIPT